MSPNDPAGRLEAETAAFRKILERGRSPNQLALFDLLVERSKDQRSPKEVEIALALFGADANLDSTADSGVRVYVHRLRKRMDDHYFGKTGVRLTIPKGEYRVVLVEGPDNATPTSAIARMFKIAASNPALTFGLSLIVGAAIALVGWNILPTREPQPSGIALQRLSLFGSGAALTDPIIIVGDSLLLAETEDQKQLSRMILYPTVRSRDDFGRYMREHPEVFYRLYDFNLNFAPLQSVQAAWSVQEKMNSGRNAVSSRIIPVSALDQSRLESKDIIYLGRLSQLRQLDSVVFAQSKFRLERYDRLVDTDSARTFAGRVYSGETPNPGTDIGYFSVATAPYGRRIVVLAGLGDRGTTAMAALLDSPLELAALKRRVGSARGFEAVYEVQSLPGRPLERRLLDVHPRR